MIPHDPSPSSRVDARTVGSTMATMSEEAMQTTVGTCLNCKEEHLLYGEHCVDSLTCHWRTRDAERAKCEEAGDE